MTAQRREQPGWIGPALLVAVTLLVYFPALGGDFMWDDDQYVVANRAVQSPSGLRAIWLHPWSTPQYYPMTLSSFWIEYRLWGANPTGYHLTNVLLHAASALLLWRILRRLSVPGAGVAAAIFALHPVQVESVAWITERKNVLSGLFYFLALDAWLGYDPPAAESTKGSRARYALAFGAFLCALLSKSVTASLPAAALLLAYWKRGRVTLRDVVPLLPFFAAGIAMGSVTGWLERHRVGAVGPDWELTLLERILVAGRALWFYASKLVWPHPLIFVYPRFEISASALGAYLYPIGAVLLGAALFLARGRLGRGPLAACLFFAGTLVPALSFVNVFPMLYSYVADHFQYLACVGPIVLAVAAAWRLPGGLRATCTLLVLGVLCALTWSHASAFSGIERLWRDTLAKNPRAWMAHSNLASYLHVSAGSVTDEGTRSRMLEEAEQEYRAAIALKPDNLPPRLQLGKLYEERGDLARAETEYIEATRVPNLFPHGSRGHLRGADPWYVYGRFLEDHGRPDEALAPYRRAVEIAPDSAMFRTGLGKLLFETGHSEEGKVHLSEAVRADPGNATALNNLAVVLASEGALDEAIARWGQALRLEPGHAEAHNNLGTALVLRGEVTEAVPHFYRAVELRPDFVLARRNLEDARRRLAGL